MVPGDHVSDEVLEQYCLGLVPAAELEALEAHLLVCARCQEHLRENESYVQIMRQATAQAAADQLASRSRWRRIGDRLFRSLPAAAIAGAAAVILVWNFTPSAQHPAAAPERVALEAMRGGEGLRAHAAAGQRLLLELDLTGLPALESYRVRIVDSRGATVLETAAGPAQGKVTVSASLESGRGLYWVRVYSPSEPEAALREYGLQLD